MRRPVEAATRRKFIVFERPLDGSRRSESSGSAPAERSSMGGVLFANGFPVLGRWFGDPSRRWCLGCSLRSGMRQGTPRRASFLGPECATAGACSVRERAGSPPRTTHPTHSTPGLGSEEVRSVPEKAVGVLGLSRRESEAKLGQVRSGFGRGSDVNRASKKSVPCRWVTRIYLRFKLF